MTDNISRVALITGGSGGIGRAVAERLAKDGIAIGVHYAGNKAKAEETVAAITAAGARRSPSAPTSPTRSRCPMRSTRSSGSSAASTWS